MKPTDSAALSALRATCKRFTISAVATKAGLEESAIRHVLSGRRTPTRAFRTAIAGAYADVSVASWEPIAATEAHRKASAPPPPHSGTPDAPASPPEPSAEDLGDLDPKATTIATVRRLGRELDRLDRDPAATSRERSQVATALTSSTRLLAKLSGSVDVTPSQILRSPHWQALQGALVAALRPFPEALAAATAALESFGGFKS